MLEKLRAALMSNINGMWAMPESHEHILRSAVANFEQTGQFGDEDVLSIFGMDDPERVKMARTELMPGPKGRSIALVPVMGVATHSVEFQPLVFSTAKLEATMARLADDDTVSEIVMFFASPGGSVFGVAEAGEAIFQARKRKKVTARVAPLAASAALWLAAQATEVSIMPSGEAGSIGVFMLHVDQSEALQNMGIKVEMIKAGKNKGAGNPFSALSDEAREKFQSDVDLMHVDFIKAVARGRGVSVKTVREDFGQGFTFLAKEAKDAGMVDRIETDAAFARRMGFGGQSNDSGGRRSEDDLVPVLEDDEAPALGGNVTVAYTDLVDDLNFMNDVLSSEPEGDNDSEPEPLSGSNAEEFSRFVTVGEGGTLILGDGPEPCVLPPHDENDDEFEAVEIHRAEVNGEVNAYAHKPWPDKVRADGCFSIAPSVEGSIFILSTDGAAPGIPTLTFEVSNGRALYKAIAYDADNEIFDYEIVEGRWTPEPGVTQEGTNGPVVITSGRKATLDTDKIRRRLAILRH